MGTDLHCAIGEYLASLRLERGRSANTVKHYAYDLQIFADYLSQSHPGVSSPAQVERLHVRAFLARLSTRRGNSPPAPPATAASR